jgi:hypothetical protein
MCENPGANDLAAQSTRGADNDACSCIAANNTRERNSNQKEDRPREADLNANVVQYKEPVHKVAVNASTCLIHASPLSYQINEH